MILPIFTYGSPVLRKVAQPISLDYADLDTLIQNMFDTMYNASGVGLAAPQVGLPIRIFVVDGAPMDDSEEGGENLQGFKHVFINPVILEETGEEWAFEEGCLSIPGIREEVWRPEKIRLKYQTPSGETIESSFEGIQARIIQHEYDHIDGVLFTDHLQGLKKQLIKSKLIRLAKGIHQAGYPTRLQKIK
jgi:peptide deformylase